MMNTIALNAAKRLGNILGSQENEEIYAYAFQLVLMLLFNLTLVILAALFLGILSTTLAFLAVFILFRAFGGGVHLSSLPRCIFIGSSLMLGSAYLAAVINIKSPQLYILFVLALAVALLVTIKWAPASTPQNPISDPNLIRSQKRNLLITIVFWAGCVGSFIYVHNNPLALAMILGTIVSAILISPLGFGLMGRIDMMLNKLQKGGLYQ